MKTRISQLAAITLLALFILGGNVKAEGTEKSASNHENIEATLELENWMINEQFWKTGVTPEIRTATDESLELENWMINRNTWETYKKVDLEEVLDESLNLECWMVNENIWNN